MSLCPRWVAKGAPPDRTHRIRAPHKASGETKMAFESARGRVVRRLARSLRRNPDDAAANTNARAPFANLTLPGPKVELRFPVGSDARAFYRRFFPGTAQAEWNDWHW